jgi:integral membrane protein (TIGR01906 family)
MSAQAVLSWIAKVLVVLLVLPILLILNVRLEMSPQFAAFEYAKPDFPMPTQIRLESRFPTAAATIAYVRSEVDLDVLRHLRDGERILYNERELAHLADVRVLTAQAFAAQMAMLALWVAALALLAAQKSTRRDVPRYMLYGSLFTIAVILVVVAVVFINFDWFFVCFHRTFFEGDSWLFLSSDTLIQIFPPMFWFDAAVGLGVLTLAEAGVVGLAAFATHRWTHTSHR